jgi:hypothetical protein
MVTNHATLYTFVFGWLQTCPLCIHYLFVVDNPQVRLTIRQKLVDNYHIKWTILKNPIEKQKKWLTIAKSTVDNMNNWLTIGLFMGIFELTIINDG